MIVSGQVRGNIVFATLLTHIMTSHLSALLRGKILQEHCAYCHNIISAASVRGIWSWRGIYCGLVLKCGESMVWLHKKFLADHPPLPVDQHHLIDKETNCQGQG
jgi:hypothetical protein